MGRKGDKGGWKYKFTLPFVLREAKQEILNSVANGRIVIGQVLMASV